MFAQAAAIVFWILLGAFGVFAGARLNIGTLEAPDAGLMPALAGSAVVIFGVVALWQAVLENRRANAQAALAPTTSVAQMPLWAPLSAVVLLSFYAALFERVGFVPATFVLIVLLARLLGSGGWISALVLGALASSISYAVFKLGLGVPLP